MSDDDKNSNQKVPSLVTNEEIAEINEVYKQLEVAPVVPTVHGYSIEPIEIQLQKLGGLQFKGINFTVSSATGS